MAQLPTTHRRRHLLASRFGLKTSWALAALVVFVLAALASFAWLRAQQTRSITIEHAPAEEARLAAEDSREPVTENAATNNGEKHHEQRQIVVHVDGAVAAPGVYTLADGARANDAVAAAGGLTEAADTQSLNLAGLLADGQKLHVSVQGEVASVSPNGSVPTGDTSQGSTGPININSADAVALQSLPGVGKVTAEAIVAERQNNGPFASVDDLTRVSGIGERKLERLRGSVCV